MYLEPCCIKNQLPHAIRNGKGNALFQTNGDVTVEHLMGAACCLASGGFGEYWICIKEVDIMLMRKLAHWMDREWIRTLHLLTETDQQPLVASELGAERMKQVDYGWREGLAAAQMLCVVGNRETIIVQGEMLLVAATQARVTSYSATLGKNEWMLGSEGAAGSLIENMRAILRMSKRKSRKKKDAEPKAEAVEQSEAEKPTAEADAPATEQPTE